MRFLGLISILFTGVFFNCTPTRPTSSGITAYGFDKGEIITKSLFDSKDRTISEDDIQRLLNGEIMIPDTARVAIFKYASTSINRYYTNWWTDEEYLGNNPGKILAIFPLVKGVHSLLKN